MFHAMSDVPGLTVSQTVAFKSYFLLLFVLTAIAVAYLCYKLGMFVMSLRSNIICEEFCEQNCGRRE